jgi:branched-chain amino acid transport system permease protein
MFFQHLANGVLISGIYALVATGFTLIFGVLEVVNFAHGEFYMLGAFILFCFAQQIGLPYFCAIPLCIGTLLVFGILVERSAIRPLLQKSFESMVICTFAISMILMNGSLLPCSDSWSWSLLWRCPSAYTCSSIGPNWEKRSGPPLRTRTPAWP